MLQPIQPARLAERDNGGLAFTISGMKKCLGITSKPVTDYDPASYASKIKFGFRSVRNLWISVW